MTTETTQEANTLPSETREFWEAADAGTLLLKKCQSCSKTFYYPRAICPHCFGSETQWIESSGLGNIYSFSVMRRVAEPYVIAMVNVDEEVTMMTNIVDCDPDSVQIDQRVQVTFKSTNTGRKVAMFTPITS
ncbi:Zn-ribbon domain-containing OB-fold protein [Sedimentitalea sp.]|uniref:Zn-ribbon domain-containing OB-fold protein n=1 Tax=Sedimentitalea sp. TaxID=2048915 RepID=UPI003299F15A